VSRLTHWILTRRGWAFEGSVPPDPKWIAIGAPHTSNWDFFVFLAAIYHWDIEARFLGKHTLFWWPLGALMRKLGGIPVHRNRARGVVEQVAEAFQSSEEMVLVIAPEGTRGVARWWKSGFLEIARATSVPIVFAAVDFRTRTVTLAEPIAFEGDVSGFMDEARSFYHDKRGLHPELESPITVREELDWS
jgi:1-acyl-sn-glycerol-3-phosphate acyltransferase